MDNRGSSVVEIMILLIIILMIVGVVTYSSQLATQKITIAGDKQHLEGLTAEVCDNLINNPGNPENWMDFKGTPGLAIVNEGGEIIPNSISYQKFSAIASDYEGFVDDGIFNSKVKSSMEIIPLESSISSVKIGHKDQTDNVYSVNRIVKCDFYRKYIMKDFQNDGKCNHGHDQNEHSCNYFKIFKGNLKKSDYYLVVDKDEKYNTKYFIDTTRNKKFPIGETVGEDAIYLNNQINFYDDTSAVVFIHFDKKDTKAFLVSVPKDFDKNNIKYDYFKINQCQFILKTWY